MIATGAAWRCLRRPAITVTAAAFEKEGAADPKVRGARQLGPAGRLSHRRAKPMDTSGGDLVAILLRLPCPPRRHHRQNCGQKQARSHLQEHGPTAQNVSVYPCRPAQTPVPPPPAFITVGTGIADPGTIAASLGTATGSVETEEVAGTAFMI